MGRARRFALMVLLVSTLVVSLMCSGLVLGDAGVDVESERDSSAPLFKEIERLKAYVESLEGSLKEKDVHLEKKDAQIGAIESELSSLKKHKEEAAALSELKLQLEATAVKVKELEENVVGATKESEKAHQYAKAMQKRAEEAEQIARDLEARYDRSQKSVFELKKRSETAEKALKNAEATINEAEKRLQAHGEELSRVHSQWLPPWAAARVATLKGRAQAKWTSHAKPHVDTLCKHATKRAAAAHAYVKPHMDNLASTVGPKAQKHWKTVSDSVSPHVELLRSKTVQGYEVVRKEYLGKAQEFLQPHWDTVVETSRPYVSSIQEYTRPYVDRLATVTKPYLDQGRKVLNPYLEKVSPYYRDTVSAAVRHHETLQQTVRNNFSKYGVKSSLVTKELVWFLASALLALPVFAALLLFSASFGGKRKKPTKRSSTSSTSGKPRRPKRADK